MTDRQFGGLCGDRRQGIALFWEQQKSLREHISAVHWYRPVCTKLWSIRRHNKVAELCANRPNSETHCQ
ncbi:hypothetical protein B0O80DRAFT_455469 [Mortierella sp. GBAus27b]|nr:hypothetical protein B0O80DRAFT_455469 [Mortierella sp. GBAus27b]